MREDHRHNFSLLGGHFVGSVQYAAFCRVGFILAMASSNAPANSHTQKLFVMRHGERLDDADPSWVGIPGVRTWDPPLTARGTEQAMAVGRRLRSEGVEITRILVSPFLRCVQTTAGFIKGMYPEGTDISKLKVSIEYGLAELMNRFAIRNPRHPQSAEPWHIPFEKLYSVLPSGVVDTSVTSMLPELPEWEESSENGHKRFSSTFFGVADKFPDENVLCVSHGEGVAVSVMHLRPDVEVYGVQYCAYTLAEREVSKGSSEAPPRTGPWRFMTQLGSESGLLYRDIEV